MLNKKGLSGVITVMISLLLTGILSFGTMVIEAGRLQAARTQLDDATLSAGTSMIASFDSDLFERYGLLAIDNEKFNIARFREYLDFNSDRAAGYKGNNISTFYTVSSVELEGMYNLTYPSVLKRQILARAKYNIIPQDYSINYYNMDYMLSDLQNKATYISDTFAWVASGSATQGSIGDVPANMQSALNVLYATFSKTKKYDEAYKVTLGATDLAILPSKTGTSTHVVPSDDIKAINEAVKDANTVLGANGALLSSNNGKSYKEVDVTLNVSFASNAMNDIGNLNALPSKAVKIVTDCRKLVQGINAAISMLSSDKEGNMLLNSYIAEYFTNKNFTTDNFVGPAAGTPIVGDSNLNFSGACAEYIFSANESELVNQQTAYDYIIATRLVSNLYTTITGSTSFNSGNACSVAAHIAWAYYETFADAELLFKHNATVPLSKYSMILPITNPSAVSSAFAGGDFLAAMRALGILRDNTFTVSGYDTTNYRDALALAFWFVPNSKKMLRVADLIQLEMRYKEQRVENKKATFLMSEQNTFCRVKCIGGLNSILPVISLGKEGEVKGTPITSIKYIGY